MSNDTSVREVVDLIERLGDPRSMDKAEYLDFLESISSEVEMRLEGVRGEMEDE